MEKRIALFSVMCFLLITGTGSAQDTLRLKDHTFYVCKVLKITDTEIEFKKWENQDGPLYTVKRSGVAEIIYKNGTAEIYSRVDVKQGHYEMLQLKNCVKVDFFSPAFDKVTIGFEHCHRYGFNSEIYASFIHNQISQNLDRNHDYTSYIVQGAGIKYCAKFLLATPIVIKGTNYVHPLSGLFFRVDMSFNQYTFLNVYTFENYYGGYGYTPDYKVGNLNVSQFAFGFSFGGQTTIGNSMTFQANFGTGYCGSYMSFKERYTTNYLDPAWRGLSYREYGFNLGHYGNIQQLGDLPIYVSANISLGYTIGKKADRKKIPRKSAIFDEYK